MSAQPLVGQSEIGRMLGVTRQRAFQLVRQPGFPAPYARLDQGAVWRTTQVERWALRQGRKLVPL